MYFPPYLHSHSLNILREKSISFPLPERRNCSVKSGCCRAKRPEKAGASLGRRCAFSFRRSDLDVEKIKHPICYHQDAERQKGGRKMNSVKRTRGIRKVLQAVAGKPVQKFVTAGDSSCRRMMLEACRIPSDCCNTLSAVLTAALTCCCPLSAAEVRAFTA